MKKPVLTPKKRGRPAGGKANKESKAMLATKFVEAALTADVDTDDFLGKSGKNTAAKTDKTSPSDIPKGTPENKKDMDEIRMPVYSSQQEGEG